MAERPTVSHLTGFSFQLKSGRTLKRASGKGLLRFPHRQPGKKVIPCRAGGGILVPMTERGEAMFSVISGLAVFAALG
jgi:hypothetical protein